MEEKKERIFLSLCVALFVTVTLFIFGPVELYFANVDEFWFVLSDIWWFIALVAIFVFCGISAVLVILKDKNIYWILLCLIFGLTLGFYIQGNFLNIDYGVMNGEKIDWSNYGFYGILNAIIWLICILLPVILLKVLGKKYISRGICFISLLAIGMQLSALGVLVIQNISSDTHSQSDSYVFTKEKMFEVSEKENIVVFVVDTLDALFIENFLEQNPEYYETLDGFTYFSNAVSGAAPTKYGLPLLLTGEHYYEDQTYNDYLNEAYSKTDLYDDLESSGYDVRIFTEANLVGSSVKDRIKNMVLDEPKVSSYTGLMGKLYEFVAFKYMPHCLKEYFWFYSGEFDQYKVFENENTYALDDVQFYEDLLENGLTVTKDENIFRVYHLFGAHGPYDMDENVRRVSAEETNRDKQIEGVFKIINDYINMLKEQGLYDKSAIVITADHGGVDLYQNPAMLVKRQGETGNLKTSKAPIGFIDFQATLASFFMDSEKYGRTFFEINEGEERIFQHFAEYVLAKNHTGKTYKSQVVEFQIAGNPREKASIMEIGEAAALYKKIKGYKLGQEVDFSERGNASDYIKEGFSGQEKNGIWTWAEEAVLWFNIKDEIKSNLKLTMNFESVFNGKQRMGIYANDIFIGEKIVTENTEEFVIPQDCFSNGETNLVIRLELPDHKSPNEINPENTDTRQLAFYFKSLVIDETDELVETNYNNENSVVFLHNGLEIDCTKDSLFIHGNWNDAEEGGRWTTSSSSCSFLMMENVPIDIEFEYNIPLWSNEASVLFNGVKVGVLEKSEEYTTKTISVPSEIIKPNEMQLLEISVEGAKSPKEVGINDDHRILGARIKKIKVSCK